MNGFKLIEADDAAMAGPAASVADGLRSAAEKLWRCPPLAGAPGAAGSGQELTVPPGRSRPAVLKKITERGSTGDPASGGLLGCQADAGDRPFERLCHSNRSV